MCGPLMDSLFVDTREWRAGYMQKTTNAGCRDGGRSSAPMSCVPSTSDYVNVFLLTPLQGCLVRATLGNSYLRQTTQANAWRETLSVLFFRSSQRHFSSANAEKERLTHEYHSLNQQHRDATAEFEATKRSVRSANVCHFVRDGKRVADRLSQDLVKRVLAEAQAAHRAVARLDVDLQEEQPLNIATFQENLDVGAFFYFFLMFTVNFQDARRELEGLQAQLTDAQARLLRFKEQADPLVKRLDSVRRKIETYEAQKDQLQVRQTIWDLYYVIPHAAR
jgi:DNA repair exonuclease SbcCD ATPase subunit